MTDINRQIRDSMKRRTNARQRARSIAMKRKEEYLGARVPGELRKKVLQRADELGIPVSNLIRDILISAFDQRDMSGGKAAGRSPEGGNPHGTRFSSVLGWEEIRLNRMVECSGCGVDLMAGATVILGLGAPDREHIVLCHKCKEGI